MAVFPGHQNTADLRNHGLKSPKNDVFYGHLVEHSQSIRESVVGSWVKLSLGKNETKGT